jgi:hypothetical protein
MEQPTPITTDMELLSGASDSQIDYDPSNGIRTPAPTDVICGRGKFSCCGGSFSCVEKSCRFCVANSSEPNRIPAARIIPLIMNCNSLLNSLHFRKNDYRPSRKSTFSPASNGTKGFIPKSETTRRQVSDYL